MTEMTRYLQDMDGYMDTDRDGPWCRFDEASASIEALQSEVEMWKATANAVVDFEKVELRKERDAALAKLEALEKQAQPEPLTDTELINRGCRYETELMQVQTEPVELTHEDIRAAGGIVHRDGNVFFTNAAMLNKAIAAKGGAV